MANRLGILADIGLARASAARGRLGRLNISTPAQLEAVAQKNLRVNQAEIDRLVILLEDPNLPPRSGGGIQGRGEATARINKLAGFPLSQPLTKLTESMKDEPITIVEPSPFEKGRRVQNMTLPAIEILSIRGVN